MLAQAADERRILGEGLHQDPPRAFERRVGVGHAPVGVHVRGGFLPRRPGRIAQQRQGERLEPGLTGNLRPGPAFGLEGQVQIFEARLRVGRSNRRGELRCQLALFLDALEDGTATVVELTEVDQPLLERLSTGCRRGRRSPPCDNAR